MVLIAAALIAISLGEEIDAIVILAIVLLNAILGFFQEYRAEKTIRALKKYVTFKTKVLRNGSIVEVDTKEIVPGDIVYLNIGDIIPADIRLLAIEQLTTDESSLTGESIPVTKSTVAADPKASLPQDLPNLAFMGTTIASGLGHGIVIATGKNTFFGKTAAYLKQKTPQADFEKNIRKFGDFLLKVILIMTCFIFLANALLGKGMFDSFLFALALAVGITPEVLPIIMTITLSNGALKMAKEKVITKKLASVEDFGNIDTLCCDKTGTLTLGTLSLQNYVSVDGIQDEKLILDGLLCNSVQAGKSKKPLGNPIDKAIWQSSKAASLHSKLKQHILIDENEFDYNRKRMSVVVKNNQGNLFIAKGASESILQVCTHATINHQKTALSPAILSKIKTTIADYEKQGYTVIAIAEKLIQKLETDLTDEKDLTLLGFLLFLDPPKPTAKDSLKLLQNLG